ncbi:MAG: CCA tRNA nucleotidyltransferase [Eubacteriales bacterium]|nr:CCA tRNA nucleotidyltransferase [Eubacteriales bacterium]
MGKENTVRIMLPEQVKQILNTLRENGFEAFAVGGCVRDSLLGRVPGDWDITTSAHPEDVKKIFKRTVDTGIEHGTVTVLLKAGENAAPGHSGFNGYEVTTYRIDGEYRDGRHPEAVSFTPSLSEDLKRRDFTINAMAYSEADGLVDLFQGLSDLEEGVIRCVGNPDDRFSEDALRILRAVRFAAQLDFTVETKTEEAIRSHAENLLKVSRERIQAELSKLLCSPHPERTAELFHLGLAAYLCEGFPEVVPQIYTELRASLGQAETGKEDAEEAEAGALLFSAVPLSRKYLRYAVMLAEMEEKKAGSLLQALKLDNDTIKKTRTLVSYLFSPIAPDRYELKKVMQQMTPELMRELLLLKQAFSRTARYRRHCPEEDAGKLLGLLSEIERREEPVYPGDLILRGSDLIAAGMEPGPELGRILAEMLDDVQHNPVHNSVLYLISQYVAKKRGK